MSDSDDTDTLLLVPPNLFAVPSESDGNPDSSVVEDLITHVERLETRVNNIEHRTSLLGSGDFANTGSHEDVSQTSVDSSSGRTLPTVLPKGDFRSGTSDKRVLLSEVDRYLESVNFPEMDNQFEVDSGASGSILDKLAAGKHLALPDVDKLLKEMESTQNEIEKKLKARENEYGVGDHTSSYQPSVRTNERDFTRSRADFQYNLGNRNDKFSKGDFITSRRAFILGENLGSVPDLGFGVRDVYHTKTNSPRKPEERNPVEEPINKRDAYLVGSSSNGEDFRNSVSSPFTQSPAKTSPQRVPLNLETRKPKMLSPKRRLPFSDNVQSKGGMTSPGTPTVESCSTRNVHHGNGDANEFLSNRFRSDRALMFQPKLNDQFRGNWLSLADLWKNEDSSLLIDDPSKLLQKLEEERVRRTHLEETVQSLNKRVLEEREKLAVAMVVDEGKDKAILQITEAWKQMVEHWKKIEADRHAMSQKLITERTVLKRAREEVDKKVERWEKEVSQALDLAAGYKSKYEFLESESNVNKEVLEGKVTDLEEQLKVKEKTLTDLLEERKILSEKLQAAHEKMDEEKRLKDVARSGMETMQGNLSKIEAELAVVKEQKELIDLRLKDEKSRVIMLEQQNRGLEEELEESKNSQLKAEEEARTAIAELESSKTELRNLYQNQLEMVVRSKLMEFQGQLDAAQLSMQAEIESTKEIAQKRAEEQHSALVNSHVTEIRRLEAIHKDELRSLELKLAESERRRLKLENNHKEIAQKLHGVMEHQWQQALTILTSELSMRQPTAELSRVQPDGHFDKSKMFLGKPSKLESESSDDHPFNKDDLVTCRSTSSRPLPGKQEQLMKYIQMLLDKTPGKAVESSSVFDSSMSGAEVQPERNGWPLNQVVSSNQQGALQDPNNPHIPMSQNKKPPWKPT